MTTMLEFSHGALKCILSLIISFNNKLHEQRDSGGVSRRQIKKKQKTNRSVSTTAVSNETVQATTNLRWLTNTLDINSFTQKSPLLNRIMGVRERGRWAHNQMNTHGAGQACTGCTRTYNIFSSVWRQQVSRRLTAVETSSLFVNGKFGSSDKFFQTSQSEH